MVMLLCLKTGQLGFACLSVSVFTCVKPAFRVHMMELFLLSTPALSATKSCLIVSMSFLRRFKLVVIRESDVD